jgi:hypothetical protein
MAGKPVNSNYNLRALVHFLNFDLEKLNSSPDSYDERFLTWFLLSTSFNSDQPKEVLIDIQAEVKSDFTSVLRCSSDSEMAAKLEALVQKIDRMSLRSSRYVKTLNGIKLDEGSSLNCKLVEIAGREFGLFEYPDDRTLQHGCYRVINDATQTNALSQIRMCSHCEKFFFRDGRRTVYCSTKCERAATYKRRVKSGYFAKKMKDRRDKQKKQKKRAKSPRIGRLQQFIRTANEAKKSGSLDRISAALRRIGQGRAVKAWEEIARWENALKNGASEATVIKTIKPHAQESMWEAIGVPL